MKLVMIEWRDAVGGTRAGWKPVADMTRDKPHQCRSVGWLVSETEERLVIVPHLTNDNDGDGELTIPKDWTQSIVELIERPKRKK